MPATPHRELARPLASLMLITFNQQHSVAEAIRGALSQTWSPLEILISDDASSDDTFAVAQQCVREYAGPHAVRLYRNETNLGISAHLSALAARASGEMLFVAAGDDISMPERCERVMNAWLDSGKRYDLIATDLRDLDADGNLHEVMTVTDLSAYHSFDDWSRNRPHVVGAAHAWARRLFTEFGPMEPGIYGEDQIMVFRAIMSGGAFTLREPLVQYRRGGLSRKRRWRTPATSSRASSSRTSTARAKRGSCSVTRTGSARAMRCARCSQKRRRARTMSPPYSATGRFRESLRCS